MKHLFPLFAILFLIGSCKKELPASEARNGYLQAVKAALQDSLSAGTFKSLDFTGAVQSRVNEDTGFLRIPFTGKPLATEFLLLQTNDKGRIAQGRIISLYRTTSTGVNQKPFSYYGQVTISSLKGKELVQSAIEEGYITAFHQDKFAASRQALLKAPDLLPEVVVVAYVYSEGVSYSDWMRLTSFFHSGGTGPGSASNYYGSTSGEGGSSYGPSNGSYGGGYSGGSSGSVKQDPPMEIEEEYIYDLPSVDIHKLFKCFDSVPSGGATYTIKLCTDLPFNGNPNASANFSAVSSGHTFLTITKSNGSATVTQSFGFYPQAMPSWLNPFAPISSSIKDNKGQEINASIEMPLSESGFNTVKRNAIAWAERHYRLDDYNCTDYALDVFNSVRTTPIKVPSYKVYLPATPGVYGTATNPPFITIDSSPQMLFQKLRDMKNNRDAEASRIQLDQSHNSRAPISNGECN